jgi:hypothetical protein
MSYYRLRQEDSNGVMTFSKTVAVELPPLSKIVLKPYPNPTHDFLTIELFHNFKALHIYDIKGVLQFSAQQVEVNVSALVAGTYFLEVENTEGEKARVKFVKE